MELGWNTFWLDLHGAVMILTLSAAAFGFGVVVMAREPSDRLVEGLKWSGVITFAGFVAIAITGMVPDTAFGSGATFSGTFNNDFGNVTRSVSDSQLGNFTGPLLFDMMEHVSLIVPALAAVIAFLLWNQGRKVITVPAIKASVLGLMSVTWLWTLVLAAIGVYITKVLTFPPGS
jgi:hypothetical protein